MKRLALSMLVVSSLVGCGESAGQKTVDYELTCGEVRCPNADETSTFESGGAQNFTCTWECACYEGSCDRYVSLEFWAGEGFGECWSLESEYTDAGICDY
jgi:hypothetical protein